MKKSVLVLIAVGLFLASCSAYTCPTYTKDIKKDKADVRIDAKVWKTRLEK